jgi:hypothetical protein
LEALLKFKDTGRQLLDAHRLFAILPNDVAVPEHLKPARVVVETQPEEKTLSHFAAPKTVRVSASMPAGAGRLHFHFVNYNRVEPDEPKSPGRGIVDEKPIATKAISCDVRLPAEFGNPRVTVFTPESPTPVAVASTFENDRLTFEVPGFLVYAVIEVLPDAQ